MNTNHIRARAKIEKGVAKLLQGDAEGLELAADVQDREEQELQEEARKLARADAELININT